jgi:thiol-disulfide isomerase/thioredoxin
MRILVIIGFLVLSCKQEVKETASTHSDTVAKQIDLKVYDFNGIQKYLNTQNDSTYVVNFWATWCAPCVKELPYFESINKNYKDKKVKVLLISLDFPNKYESSLKPFILKHNLQSEVVALNDPDSNNWIPKIDEQWSGALPATLIFNKSKRQFYEQSFEYDALEDELKQFLN